MTWEEYRKGCYYLSREAGSLMADGTFNQKAESLIQEGLRLGSQTDAIAYMENVMAHGDEYARADREFAPILIYRSDSTCYDILNRFAERMAEALTRLGETVQIIDLSKTLLESLSELSGKSFKAILGFQTYIFSLKLENGANFHDTVNAPKFNMLLDHPASFHKHLCDAPKDCYILTHDRNYARHIEKYYPNIKGVRILPPAGEMYTGLAAGEMYTGSATCEMCSDSAAVKMRSDSAAVKMCSDSAASEMCSDSTAVKMCSDSAAGAPDNVKSCGLSENKLYDISFVGTHRNPESWKPYIDKLNERFNGLANELIEYMLNNTGVTYEDAVQTVIKDVSRDTFYDLIDAYFYVMTYERKKIIKTILDAGITLHVFGDSWRAPCYEGYDNLIVHPSREGDDALKIYAQSRLSLNIMSWHKDGMTERIANIMQNGAVAVTDKSRYLCEHYTDGTDIIFYDLEHLEELPEKIRSLTSDLHMCQSIADNARRHSLEADTWDIRAKQFLEEIK